MNILVLGANSDIGFETCKEFAKHHQASFHLASTNTNELERKAKDLMVRFNSEVKVHSFNATDYDSHQSFFDSLDPKPDLTLCCFAYASDQRKAQSHFSECKRMLDINILGSISILEIVAKDFEDQKKGCIIGISSPAGDRGRKSNYLYGATKACFSVFLQGLRHRLHNSGVQVIDVRPGFTKTKMTEGMKLPPLLTVGPEKIASDIYFAYKKGKPKVYTPWFWTWIMLIIRSIPEKIFIKSSL